MPFNPAPGVVYELHRQRRGLEIGPATLTRSRAIRRIERGGDVYTRLPGDAKSLAKDAYHNRACDRDLAHKPPALFGR